MGDGCDSGEGEQMDEEHLDLIQGDNLEACHLSGKEKEQVMQLGEDHLDEFSGHLGDSPLQRDNLEELSGHLGGNTALLQMEDELPQHPALLQCSSRKVNLCQKLKVHLTKN